MNRTGMRSFAEPRREMETGEMETNLRWHWPPVILGLSIVHVKLPRQDRFVWDRTMVRILTLLRFGRCPQLFPVMIVSGFFQGTKISQSFGSPKLSGSLETKLTLATS